MQHLLKGIDMRELRKKAISMPILYPRDLLRKAISICFMEEDVCYAPPRSILGYIHIQHVEFDANTEDILDAGFEVEGDSCGDDTFNTTQLIGGGTFGEY